MGKLIRLTLLLWMGLLGLPAMATNYYVATTGSNSNNGLSTATPFRTVTYAATIATHGDTIHVMAGVYTNATYGTWNLYKTEQTIKINNKNSATGNYLVIQPYMGGAVKFRGDGDYIFQIRNSSHIRVVGFEIEGEVNHIPLDSARKYQFVYRQCLNGPCSSYLDTFRVAFGTPPAVIENMTFPVLSNIINPTTINNIGLLIQNSHHIDIRNCHIHHNTGTGLRAFQCDHVSIVGNTLHDNSRRSSVGNHGLVIHSATSVDQSDAYKYVISQNLVYDNYNEVYSWSPLKTFITPHIDEGKGISLQKNTVANGWTYGKFLIENNIAHHNGFSGIHVNEGIRMDIVNNTVHGNHHSYDGHGNNLGISVQSGDSIGIYNNIAVAPTVGSAIAAGGSTHLTVANNLVQGLIDSDVDAVDVNTVFANPLFVDTLQYKLQSGSPAIDNSEISVAPALDFYGLGRIGVADRGAVEFDPATFLPVDGLAFRLQVTDSATVELQWEADATLRAQSYVVERLQRDATWQPLVEVPAIWATGSPQSYTAHDAHPFAGANHYRLMVLDADQHKTYSEVLRAYMEEVDIAPQYFPNPTSRWLSSNIDLSQAELYAIDGRKVVQPRPMAWNGWDLTGLPKGLYLVTWRGIARKIVVE